MEPPKIQVQKFSNWLQNIPSDCKCIGKISANRKLLTVEAYHIVFLSAASGNRLLFATQKGCLGCVQWLLNDDALELYVEPIFGFSVLSSAVKHSDILYYLLSCKADVNGKYDSPLTLAIQGGYSASINMLIDFGANHISIIFKI